MILQSWEQSHYFIGTTMEADAKIPRWLAHSGFIDSNLNGINAASFREKLLSWSFEWYRASNNGVHWLGT